MGMINQLRSLENAGLEGEGCGFCRVMRESHIGKVASEQRTGRKRGSKPCKQRGKDFQPEGLETTKALNSKHTSHLEK